MMPEAAADDLLDAAWALGIRNFDTAEAYGASATRLSNWLIKCDHLGSAHVITKIATTVRREHLRSEATDAISKFRGARKITLLSHGPIHGDNWRLICAAAAAAGARAGQSVYERDEVSDAWSLEGVSVVQAPANVFDSRAMIASTDDSREMHYRSVFLQGLLLEDPTVAEARVPGSGRLARAVWQAAAMIGVSAAALLAAAILRTSRLGDRIVLGADGPEDLGAIALAMEVGPEEVDEFLNQISKVPAAPPTVLDPRKWDRRL